VVVKILKYEFLIFEVARILAWPGYLPIMLEVNKFIEKIEEL
jgi:hypothetical protein